MRLKLLSLSLLATTLLSAQHLCHTSEVQNEWFNKHPELRAAYENRRQQNLAIEKQQSAGKSASVVSYTIPVVFHILHTGGPENISDAQVNDAVNILTRDFNKLNQDTQNVVLPFKNLIGNTRFEFKLATKDPNGNCTNGIIRHYDPNTNWSGDFADYIYSWPNTMYLNIYVVKTIGFGAAGYTYLPGSGIPNSADAIVILNGYVGSIGTGNAFTSRALTHEVGHWFDLEHTWGFTNSPGVACGDDGIGDTPITKGFTSCNLNGAADCNPPIVENVQNYMDYSYCSLMFTGGQSQHMQNTINSPVSGRNNLSSNTNLFNTGITSITSNCIPLLDIAALPSLTVCTGKPFSLVSYTSNSAPTSYSWSSNSAAIFGSPGNQTTSVIFSNPGTAIVTCVASGPGGSNSKSLNLIIMNGATNYGTTYSESFEAASLPPNWSVINGSSSGQQWQSYTGAASLGVKSMFVPGELLAPNTVQILEGPSYDFKNNPGAQFTFKYAYARKDYSNKDVFKVQASKNCGGSWTDIWVPGTAALANASGGVNSLPLVPFNEWKLYNLTAHPAMLQFLNEPNVRIRFYFEEDPGGTGYGNRLFLDEINYTTPVLGVNELTKELDFNVYPNPTNGAVSVAFQLSDAAKVKCRISNLAGMQVLPAQEYDLLPGKQELLLNENGNLSAGVYLVTVEINGIQLCRKLSVQ